MLRALKIDVMDMNNKFVNAVSGLQGAIQDIQEEEMKNVDDVSSFRYSHKTTKSPIKNMKPKEASTSSHSYASAAAQSSTHEKEDEDIVEPNTSAATSDPQEVTGAVPRDNGHIKMGTARHRNSGSTSSPKNTLKTQENRTKHISTCEEQTSQQTSENDWSLVGHRRKRRVTSDTLGGSRMVGAGRGGGTQRTVRRTADVFIGRLETCVTAEDISNFIKTVFNVFVHNVQKLDIFSRDFVAFKVNVNLSDRIKLFNSELWPEDVIVDKYFNRNSKRV